MDDKNGNMSLLQTSKKKEKKRNILEMVVAAPQLA